MHALNIVNLTYLGTSNHHPIVEAEMQNSLAMMNQCVDHFTSLHVPNTNSGVT